MSAYFPHASSTPASIAHDPRARHEKPASRAYVKVSLQTCALLYEAVDIKLMVRPRKFHCKRVYGIV